ncbi:MAG TPA: HEAT repeat domain-containing protein [Thermoanaerobaculaceae bacterium]|nr:HEAT repeat domain-containing protein [Thermoanaerobaculaceae bacterium]
MGAERDETVVRLLSDVEALRRSLRLYPASHPSLQPARERLRERVLALGPAGQVVTASFGPGRLFWNGREIALPPITPAARLIPLLFHLGLAAVRLTLPEAADGVVELATRLAALSDPPGEADRAALLDQATALAGIELVPIDLSGVQLLDSDHPAAKRGARPVWAELAQRLSRDGVFPLDGMVHDGELQPGVILDLLAVSGDPDSLFDHLFRQLAEIVKATPEARRPVAVAEVREYFAEVIRLLDPERRTLAVVAALRHLPVVSLDDPWVAGDVLLDAVERMLIEGLPIPDDVQKVLHVLASPQTGERREVPDGVVGRARQLLARIPLERDVALSQEVRPAAPAADLSTTEWALELRDSLGEEQVRRQVVRLLQEAITLWPGEEVAERSAVRLAEEFVAALEIEDLETATRLAPLVAATRSEEARRLATDGGVAATVRCLRVAEKHLHADLVAILVSLGERALPAVLSALGEEESLGVRRRLLEVVTRQGPKAMPYLRELLDDPRWFVVRNAAFLMRRIDPEAARPLLKPRIEACHPKVLVEILKALVAQQDPEWLPALARELDSGDDGRREAALEVASRIRHSDVTRLLLDHLDSRVGKRLKEPFSIEVIRALGTLRDPDALELLQRVVALRQWRYPFSLRLARREAAAAIARLEGPAAHRAAIALAASRDRSVADAARAAMHARPDVREEDE